MSTKSSAASVESIIKPKYTHLLKELSLTQLCDHLYERNMIDKTLKEKIENATTCEDSNRLYIDHLIANSTISILKQFSQLLVDTSEKLCNEVHREVGRALLDQIGTADSSTTSSIQSTLSEQSHLKDVSQSPDTGKTFVIYQTYNYSASSISHTSINQNLNNINYRLLHLSGLFLLSKHLLLTICPEVLG